MEPISLEELDRGSAEYDREVARAGEHAHFCSTADWILPAAAALMPARQPWLYRGESGYIALMRGVHPRGFRYLEPLEASWGLACPLIGADPQALAAELGELCRGRQGEFDVLVLCGVIEGSPLLRAVGNELAGQLEVQKIGEIERFVASLDGGLDGFLARRSANARRSLVRARRRAAAAGFEMTEVAATGDGGVEVATELFERVLAVEERSWKGRAGVGICAEPMRGFYRLMLPRLIGGGRLRLLFARRGGRDVGYILGARFGHRYRGLQFSFDHALAEHALGNVMQLEQIARLCEEGVTEYDLGATGEHYKVRFADRSVRSLALALTRR